MLRERDCRPGPHDLSHVVQALNAVTRQCTGHVSMLQDCVSSVCGQAAPPLRTAVSMVRERDCTPSVPHDLLHVVQSPKMLTSQSTGHACALHACVSAVCGHATPPLAMSVLMSRERDCVPPLHDLLHVVHAWKALTSQSVEQACTLHVRVSSVCGHATPPLAYAVPTVRERDCVPPLAPHDTVQVVQPLKAPTVQSAGQAWSLHTRVSSRYGHS